MKLIFFLLSFYLVFYGEDVKRVKRIIKIVIIFKEVIKEDFKKMKRRYYFF